MADIAGAEDMVAISKSKNVSDVGDEQVVGFCQNISHLLKGYLESLQHGKSTGGQTAAISSVLTDEASSALATYIRCLRNLCPNSDHQSIIGESDLLPYLTQLLGILLAASSRESFSLWPLLRVSLQLCGNLAVGCPDNVNILWPLLYPSTMVAGTSSSDTTTVNITVMIVDTCLTVDPSRRSYLYTDVTNGRRLLAQLLLLTKCDDLEWPLLLGERLVSGSDFPALFEGLQDNVDARVVLVDLLNATLSDNTDATVSPSTTASFQSGNAVFAETALFLAAQCAVWAQKLPFSAPSKSQLSADISLGLSVVQYISYLSSREDGRHILMKSPAVFTTVLGTLRRLTPPVGEASETFVSEEEGKSNPCHGLKRDLVRCLANLLSLELFKDQLCAEEGMVVLLNNCRVDHCNPYVGQWAILAIHNACEGHRGNQAVIGALKKQGSADVSLLRKMGMDVDVSDDGTVKIKVAKLPE